MTPEETQISDRLRDLAQPIAPPRVTVGELTGRIRRWRNARQAAIAVGSVSVLAGAGFLATSVFAPQHSRDTLTTASTPSAHATATSPALSESERRARTSPEVHVLKCGQAVESPTVDHAGHDIRIVVKSLSKAADGSPVTSVQIVSESPVQIRAPLAPTLLITHLGRIVALSREVDNTPPGVPDVFGAVGVDYFLNPQHPYPVTVRGEKTPCPGLTWAQIWAQPTAYQAAVVVPTAGLIWNRTGPDDHLLITELAFTEH